MDLTSIPRTLKTHDLQLRPSRPDDAQGMFDILSDPESMKYWCKQPLKDIEAARKVLSEDIALDKEGKCVVWSITLRGQDAMIGKCILFQVDQQNHRAEIGYILNRDYWRRGLMKQALGAVLEFAFEVLDLHRIEADVDTDNVASLGILEHFGFQREGLFRDRWLVYDEWQDSVMLALLKHEWLEIKSK